MSVACTTAVINRRLTTTIILRSSSVRAFDTLALLPVTLLASLRTSILALLLTLLSTLFLGVVPACYASDTNVTHLTTRTAVAHTQEKPQSATFNKTILILGDSLSAGYGINIDNGWVSLLQNRLAEGKYNYDVVNASISGETAAGGLRRLPYTLEQWPAHIVIVELGGNDALRGGSLTQLKKYLSAIIKLNRAANAKTLLLGMQIPPNYGPRYASKFHQTYSEISKELNVALVPFFLDGIATNTALMQADGIHPKAEAQAQMLDIVWPKLKPLL